MDSGEVLASLAAAFAARFALPSIASLTLLPDELFSFCDRSSRLSIVFGHDE